MRTGIHRCLSIVLGAAILALTACATSVDVDPTATTQSALTSTSTDTTAARGPIGEYKRCCIPMTCPGWGMLWCTGNGMLSIDQAVARCQAHCGDECVVGESFCDDDF